MHNKIKHKIKLAEFITKTFAEEADRFAKEITNVSGVEEEKINLLILTFLSGLMEQGKIKVIQKDKPKKILCECCEASIELSNVYISLNSGIVCGECAFDEGLVCECTNQKEPELETCYECNSQGARK